VSTDWLPIVLMFLAHLALFTPLVTCADMPRAGWGPVNGWEIRVAFLRNQVCYISDLYQHKFSLWTFCICTNINLKWHLDFYISKVMCAAMARLEVWAKQIILPWLIVYWNFHPGMLNVALPIFYSWSGEVLLRLQLTISSTINDTTADRNKQ